MRNHTRTTLFRRPITWSLLATMLVLVANGAIRSAIGTFHGGGSYEESVALPTTGTPSTGTYLALVYRSTKPTSFNDVLRLSVGLDIDVVPKTPTQYRTVPAVGQTAQSRRVGGAASLEQAADAAWVAANRTVRIDLDGVSSVLNITNIDASATAALGNARAGDRILTINGEPASARTWDTHVEEGFDLYGPRAYGRDVEFVVATSTGEERIVVPVQVRSTQLSDNDLEFRGSVGMHVEEITLLSTPRPELVVPERVSGPSAGIVHALVYLDAITDGDLTGGLRIAATGTINSVGRIERIGGMRYKAEAAQAADADVLFVPYDNEAEAVRAAPDTQVVPIGHLADAVRWLCRAGGVSYACYTTWLNGPVVGIPPDMEHLAGELRLRLYTQAETALNRGPR
jgi:PDZ domain-containing secreted protein